MESHADPEVHIGLENLQHFPAFGSPPHHSCPPAQPDFTVDPPSPLGSSPASGELSAWPQLGWWSYLRSPPSPPVSVSVPVSCFLAGVIFPVLAGQSLSPPVGSTEDDSHCMSFAQVRFFVFLKK